MPELQPRPNVNPVANTKPTGPDKREDKKEKVAREAEEKRSRKDEKKGDPNPPIAFASTDLSPQRKQTKSRDLVLLPLRLALVLALALTLTKHIQTSRHPRPHN